MRIYRVGLREEKVYEIFSYSDSSLHNLAKSSARIFARFFDTKFATAK